LCRPEFLLGCFGVELAASAVPEALMQSGFDVLIVDTEHSAFGLGQVSNLVTACRAAGLAAVVRVSDHARTTVTRAADMWPDGLMFPGVGSEAEARAIVEVAKYAPLGRRGVCPMVRYEPLTNRYETLNDRLALVLQIEGEAALSEAPKIAGVRGVDAVFVGVYDLAQSLGLAGQIEHPRVLEAGRRLRSELPDTTALGVYVSNPAMAHAWLDIGATFIAYSTDALLFLAGCKAAAQSVLAD
jgi:4-hydroxy-2-oxoheptanedioate aldolase